MSKINTVEDILLGLPRSLVTLITSFLYIKKKKPIKTLEDILSNLPSSLINYILTFLYEKKDIGEINFRRKFFTPFRIKNTELATLPSRIYAQLKGVLIKKKRFKMSGTIGRRPFVGENEIKILCQNEEIIKNCRAPFFHLGIVENNGKYNFYILRKIMTSHIENKNMLKLRVWSWNKLRIVAGYEIIDVGNDFFEALDKLLGSGCKNCANSKKKITCKSLYDNIFFQNY
jgi:hypothetical protein